MSKTPADTYTHPVFTVSPSYCGLVYEYSIGKITGQPTESAVTRSDKTFSFSYNKKLTTYTSTQTITVTGKSKPTIYNGISKAAVSQGSAAKSFTLSFVDPCITNGYVKVTG